MTTPPKGFTEDDLEPAKLLAIQYDGRVSFVENSFDGIKRGMNDLTVDFQKVNDKIGLYINDNGMLDGSFLNLAASMYVGYPLYGPVVACAATPTDEGEAVAADMVDLSLLVALASMAQGLHYRAATVGQVIQVVADPSAVPPAQIVRFPDIDPENHFRGR